MGKFGFENILSVDKRISEGQYCSCREAGFEPDELLDIDFTWLQENESAIFKLKKDEPCTLKQIVLLMKLYNAPLGMVKLDAVAGVTYDIARKEISKHLRDETSKHFDLRYTTEVNQRFAKKRSA